MPRKNPIKILAVIGGGEPFDITPTMAEIPMLLTITTALAQGAAFRDLLHRIADLEHVEDLKERLRRYHELMPEVGRTLDAVDEEASRQVRALAAELARFSEANVMARRKAFRLVGEKKAVKPRGKPSPG
jgi:hypothetical protein